MPNYRRSHTPGASWFFTVNLHDRRDDLLVREIDRLRAVVAQVRARWPFTIIAWVVLPEHMHWIWRLPEGDADYSTRWRLIRRGFTLGLPVNEQRSTTRLHRGERGVWQRRFWEHQLRDEDDLARHVDYIHWNPVKHGHVARACDWPHSSFHAFVERGLYPADWGLAQEIVQTAGE